MAAKVVTVVMAVLGVRVAQALLEART